MMKSESKNMSLRLPADTIEVIFSKIPIMYLPTCRSVCKSWNDLILNYALSSKLTPNTFFLCTFYSTTSIHCIDLDPKLLERTSNTFNASIDDFDHDWSSLSILDSCNGLILLSKYRSFPKKVEYGIFNPMTNEYIKLPISKVEEEGDKFFFYGFGYSPKTSYYKVARVDVDTKLSRSVFETFSFGGNQQYWRYVDHVPYRVYEDAVYFDGALYWIGIGIDRDGENRNFICRLDIDGERIQTTTLSLPKVSQVLIGTFNGSIYATALCFYPYYEIQVWKLHRFGGEDSWIRENIVLHMPKSWIHWTFFFQLIKDYEDGETFCLVNQRNFIFFNRKFATIKPFNNDLSLDFLSIRQIESINFGSLPKILARDDR